MQHNSKPHIRIHLLNDIRIETPAGRIDPHAEVVFAAALYLLLDRRASVPRKILSHLLWPDAGEATASHRLRQTLLKLKKIGLPISNSSRTNIGLADSAITIDLNERLQNGSVRTDADCIELGQLLAGYNPSFSAPFAEWFENRRNEFVSAVTRFMLERIATYRLEGRWSEVDVWAGSLHALSPYNEEATLALAESLAMRGAKLEAKRLLDGYLRDLGPHSSDLRIEADLLRHRISKSGTPEEAAHLDSQFVGRAADIRPMMEMLGRVKLGSGEAVLILGDAGIGKSRLVHELGRYAKLEGFSVHRIQCRAGHVNQPLAAFVELAPLLRRLRGAIGCSSETLADLDRLASYRPPTGQTLIDAGDSQWAYGRILRALFDILDAVSDESPLLIHIEDAHWLDSTSSGILAEMTDWCKSHAVCFALTARDMPQHWKDELASSVHARHLRPLDEGSSRLLFTEIARRGPKPIDSSYVDWCVAAAEGNPYFLQELATHWGETGDKTALPPSLSSVLSSRVDRLRADELQLLQLCALLENNSTLARIERILGYEPHRLLEAINGLGSAGMLTLDNVEVGVPNDRISSKHDVLSQVALQRLTNPARVYLHRKIAQALESEVESAFSASLLWECAKHWRLGGDAKRALSLALSCGQHLMDMGLSTEAIDSFERCLPYCTSDSERLAVLEAEVVVYYRGSDWKRVRDVTQIAKAIKKRIAPSNQHDDLELMDLRAQWQSLQWSEIATQALACLDAPDATARHRVEAGTMALMLVGFQSDTERLPRIYDKVCLLIDQYSLPEALRHQADMVYHTEFGDIGTAIAAARRLINTHRGHGNIAELFRAHCNAGVAFRVAGLFTEAEASLLDALGLAERYELSASIIRVLPMLGNLALERGEFDRAREYHQRMLSLVIDSANEIAALEVGALGARLALIDNDGEKARQLWPLSRLSAIGDKVVRRRAYDCALQTAIDLALTGTPDEATLASLLEACRKSQRGLHQAFNFCVARTALRRIGRASEGDQLFEEYLANRREPWSVPDHLVLGADLLMPIQRAAGLQLTLSDAQ